MRTDTSTSQQDHWKLRLSIFLAMLFIQGCSYRSLGRKAFETRMENSNSTTTLSILGCQTQAPSTSVESQSQKDSSEETILWKNDLFTITSQQKNPTNVLISVTEQLPNLNKTCLYSLNGESSSSEQLDPNLLNNLMRWTEEIGNN